MFKLENEWYNTLMWLFLMRNVMLNNIMFTLSRNIESKVIIILWTKKLKSLGGKR